MYTRQIDEMPPRFVENGKIHYGTFMGHPSRLDIRGVFKPYGTLPMPTFVTNLRIKSRLIFSFNVGDYIGHISFFDGKIAGFSEVIVWNKKTRQRFSYHSLMGPRKRFVPHSLECAATSNYIKKRYTRISWDREHDKLSVVFNLKGNRFKPSIRACLNANFTDKDFAELTTVRPYPVMRRCAASYHAVLNLHGKLNLSYKDGRTIEMEDTKGFSFFDMSRSYMKYRAHGRYVLGLGEVKGRMVAFRISCESHDSVNQNLYNSNVLFCDGKVTPLPPVLITHRDGIGQTWVIQDTENMVDLTFTPLSVNTKKISAFVLRTEYHTIYGTFEGAVMTSEGESISFKNLTGLAENYLLRL